MDIYFDQKYTTHQKRPPLKALILITDLKASNLPQIINKKSKLQKQYSASLTALGTGFHKISIQRTIGSQDIKGEIIIDEGLKGAWVVLTEGDSYFVAHVLETLFDSLYPLISRLYLNYSQMRYLLGILQSSCEGKTTQTRYTVKRINPETHHVGTQILWDRDVESDIDLMLSRGLVVKVARLDFELRDKDNALLRAQVSRNGLCKLKFGSFTSFYQNVVFNAIEYGLTQKEFYNKRDRMIENDSVVLHPLQINYDFQLVGTQTSRFVKKITSRYSCSVVHGGNPYFVADLCDYINGSSFDIAILGNSVTVTPVANTSSFAVWKIMREIQEIFGDGKITEVTMRQA